MTNQEVFDIVATHLLKQGVKCLNTDLECSYRNETGLRCAAGAIIPDSVYTPSMEGRLISEVIAAYPGLTHLEPHIFLLTRLQNIHDTQEPKDWEFYLTDLAQEYNLKMVRV